MTSNTLSLISWSPGSGKRSNSFWRSKCPRSTRSMSTEWECLGIITSGALIATCKAMRVPWLWIHSICRNQALECQGSIRVRRNSIMFANRFMKLFVLHRKLVQLVMDWNTVWLFQHCYLRIVHADDNEGNEKGVCTRARMRMWMKTKWGQWWGWRCGRGAGNRGG